MRLLADENFPRPALQALRQASLDVLWIAETNAGAADDEVLALCVATNRTLLTLDKDFGELAYRRRLPSQCGIILFRNTPQSSDEFAAPALFAIQSQQSWEGHFSVVTRQTIRMRPLPGLPPGEPDPALPKR
jgi:predicted nuclease of predicted toxin-antitoxin system